MGKLADGLRKFYEDSNKNLSWGRLAATFCLVAVVGIFTGSLFYPQMKDYAERVINSLLLSASGFYGMSKGTQGVEALAGKSAAPGGDSNA